MAQRIPVSVTTRHVPLAPGSVVRGYTLHFLGAGGMSVVYRAHKDGRDYVLKEVAGDQSQQVLAITQERALLERLKHPGIVGFEGLFEEDGHYYLVLEFIEGTSLSKLPAPSEAQVRNWAIQLCDIFAYLHSQSPPIIYRDLKPENILLQGDRIRLIDFGIARLHKGSKVTDTESLGSVISASPEHYGGSQTDVRSDIYTLGATLYHLLCDGGEFQHPAPFVFPPVRQVNPAVSADLERVLERCLAFKPEDRFQSMAALRTALGGATEPKQSAAKSRLTWLVGAILIATLGMAAWLAPGPSAPRLEQDTGLAGDIFAHNEEGGRSLVTLGDSIGLFWVTAAANQTPAERAEVVAGRLNKLYHSHCPACGALKLEPAGIQVGRYKKGDISEIVVFYAHKHDQQLVSMPELLATVDKKVADEIEATPPFVASHWRNLLRDVVQMSRGRAPVHSSLGDQLKGEFQQALTQLGPDPTVGNLETILSKLTHRRALESQFQVIPDELTLEPDQFIPTGSYLPLKG